MPRPASSPYSLLKYKNMVITSRGLNSFPPTHSLMSLSRTAGGALTATGEEITALSLVLMVGAVGEVKRPPWLQTIPGATNR